MLNFDTTKCEVFGQSPNQVQIGANDPNTVAKSQQLKNGMAHPQFTSNFGNFVQSQNAIN
jgi:hypothetical protein